MPEYHPSNIETKWQKIWEKTGLFQGTVGKTVENKLYLLFAFAYPSGSGLHVGHVESKTALDILARYNRMRGRQVFFPVGWDAFGLPAENYAVRTGVHPAETTRKAIDTFRRQIKRLGISYDWKSEVATSHPEYYKWTQWIFLKLFEKGMAYKKPGMVNWCPSCQTVLANEQVVDGVCERCGTEVVQKSLEQWYFKITDYKDELITDLEQVDWPKATEEQQLNWIGKSEGANVQFVLVADGKSIGNLEVYTTAHDTIFGCTFMVVAPEHGLVENILSGVVKVPEKTKKEVKRYVEYVAGKTELERQTQKKKTGVMVDGVVVINPVNGEKLPIYVADYVLAGYGAGAIMAVPGHDERDFEFASEHGLKVVFTAKSKSGNGDIDFISYGQIKQSRQDFVVINSGEFDGMDYVEGRKAILDRLKREERGEEKTQYKLRDWLISRQRYWGAPIPIVYDKEGKVHPVKEEHLPWRLPTDVEFKPTGESPLHGSAELKDRVEKLYGVGWSPEYDTMDTFVDSSWYFLRYPTKTLESTKQEAQNSKQAPNSKLEITNGKESLPFDPELTRAWLPVDFYMIGPEHIVLHLLYARFLTKFLRDCGYLQFDEPFTAMRHQGMILGPDHKKMSKSKGNVIDPDVVISKFGADTLRVYEMFMGPIEADKPWAARSVVGVYRFLSRIYTLANEAIEQNKSENRNSKFEKGDGGRTDQKLLVALHKTIQAVSEDIPKLKFNTAIARMMEFVNLWGGKNTKVLSIGDADLGLFVKVLAPFAPFMSEELWQNLKSNKQKTENNDQDDFVSVHTQTWPEWDPKLTRDETVVIPVQVNGKLRGQVEVAREKAEDKERVLKLARENGRVAKWIEGKEIKREVWVPGKLVNLVV